MNLTEKVIWWHSLSQDLQIEYLCKHGYQYPLSNKDISEIWYDEIGEAEEIKKKAILMARGVFDEYPKELAAEKIRNFYSDLAKNIMEGNGINSFDVENWIINNI